MIKMPIEDFIYEIKEEMACYADIGTEGADKWEAKFRERIASKGKKKNIVASGDKLFYTVGDESEIFDIADEYLDAIENGREAEYWKNI